MSWFKNYFSPFYDKKVHTFRTLHSGHLMNLGLALTVGPAILFLFVFLFLRDLQQAVMAYILAITFLIGLGFFGLSDITGNKVAGWYYWRWHRQKTMFDGFILLILSWSAALFLIIGVPCWILLKSLHII